MQRQFAFPQRIQRKRQFFALAGLLLAIATAVLISAVASRGIAGLVVFPILMMLGVFSLLLPIGVGRYVEDYDHGRRQLRQEFGPPIAQVIFGLVLVVLQVVQLASAPRLDVATLRWITLAAGAAMTLAGTAQLAVVYRRRKLQARHSGPNEDTA